MKQRLPLILLVIYVIYFFILGINPYSRPVWFVENMAIVPIVLFLAFTYRKFQFSNISYIMMSFLRRYFSNRASGPSDRSYG